MLKVNIYNKSYSKDNKIKKCLEDLHFEIDENKFVSFVSVVGESGSGKSTLLNLISGVDRDFTGSIDGNQKNNIYFATQEIVLLPWRTLAENILLAEEIENKITEDKLEKVRYYLEKYQIDKFQNHYPSEISGGMKQKIAFIRCLITDRKILLLDEPFSAVDEQMRSIMVDDLKKETRKGKTVIYVTHNFSEARSHSDKIVEIKKPKE